MFHPPPWMNSFISTIQTQQDVYSQTTHVFLGYKEKETEPRPSLCFPFPKDCLNYICSSLMIISPVNQALVIMDVIELLINLPIFHRKKIPMKLYLLENYLLWKNIRNIKYYIWVYMLPLTIPVKCHLSNWWVYYNHICSWKNRYFLIIPDKLFWSLAMWAQSRKVNGSNTNCGLGSFSVIIIFTKKKIRKLKVNLKKELLGKFYNCHQNS